MGKTRGTLRWWAAPGMLLLATVLIAVAWCSMAPAQARADEQTVVAHTMNESETHIDDYYYSIDEAINAGYEGKIIVMDVDWNLNSTLTIAANKSITIDMNGCRISNNGNLEVIRLKSHSNLTLMSGLSARLTYKGYTDGKENTTDVQVVTGGLVTGGRNKAEDRRKYSYSAGGVVMDANSVLTLDNVVVGGNTGDRTGGIVADEGCTVNLQNEASVEYNGCGDEAAGGITAWKDNVTINMDNSFIKNNYGYNGGGICSQDNNTKVNMKNGAAISNNYAQNNGGGVFFDDTFFSLSSEDGKATINGNSCGNDGGGIYTASDAGSNEGLVQNLAITGNTAYVDGGGIYLDQEGTGVVKCTITGNTAKEDGGGVYVCNDDNHIMSCTITGNVCNDDGKNYEGGGVFVGYKYDLGLTGKCIIRGNTRGKNGSDDDLFLSANVGNTASAYITGGVDLGSKVGIRTGIIGDQRIGDHVTTYAYGAYFIDLDGYYVSHGDDHGGDLWQRHRNVLFNVSVNGQNSDRTQQGTTITVHAGSGGEGEEFAYWDAEATTGLYPVEDYINDETKYNEELTFDMPQNDVNVVAVYKAAGSGDEADASSEAEGAEDAAIAADASAAPAYEADSGTSSAQADSGSAAQASDGSQSGSASSTGSSESTSADSSSAASSASSTAAQTPVHVKIPKVTLWNGQRIRML